MFCTNCGKELGQGDRFCAYCGKEAPFVPLFKREAKDVESESPRKPILDINWDLDGYPKSGEKKKTEEIDFDWNSIAKSKQFKPIEVKKIEQEENREEGIFILPEFQFEEQNDFEETDKELSPESSVEPTLSLEELEDELFGSEKEEENIQEKGFETIIFDKDQFGNAKNKFYTFNQKQHAFAELLEKEKERLKEMGGEEFFAQIDNADNKPDKTDDKKETSFVGVELPVQPLTVEIKEAKNDSPFQQSPKLSETVQISKLSPEEKVKLRYSDIFPRDLAGIDSDNVGSDNKENEKEEKNESVAGKLEALYSGEEEEAPKKKRGFGKFILIFLIIIIVFEGALIGVKFLSPDSVIAKWADDIILKVSDMLNIKNGEDTDDLSDEQTDFRTYMNAIVAKEAMDTSTIGGISYTEEFSYEDVKTPAFPEVDKARKFVDEEWFTDSKGNEFTYAMIMARTLAKYYDAWQSINQDESLLSINSVEIGEILKGEDGFYVLDKVTYANADGSDTVKYQTIHLKTSDNAMIISELKEETLNV